MAKWDYFDNWLWSVAELVQGRILAASGLVKWQKYHPTDIYQVLWSWISSEVWFLFSCRQHITTLPEFYYFFWHCPCWWFQNCVVQLWWRMTRLKIGTSPQHSMWPFLSQVFSLSHCVARPDCALRSQALRSALVLFTQGRYLWQIELKRGWQKPPALKLQPGGRYGVIHQQPWHLTSVFLDVVSWLNSHLQIDPMQLLTHFLTVG